MPHFRLSLARFVASTDPARRYARGRFIATHLGVIFVIGIAGYLRGIANLAFIFIHLLAICAVFLPLVLLAGARRPDIITVVSSTLLALLLLAAMFVAGFLMALVGVGHTGGSWN